MLWTGTPGDDLDMCEPGDDDERRAFSLSQQTSRKARKRKATVQPRPSDRRLRWEAPSNTLDEELGGFWGSPPLQCGRQELCSAHLTALPIDAHMQDVLDMVEKHHVSIIEAETGAGKSTRVPRFLLLDAIRRGGSCCIAVGVPRVVAAQNLAERVAQEAGEEIGNSVGLFTDEHRTHPCRMRSVSFATFGSLLHRVRRSIKGCCTIVLDEVHEGSVELDLLLLAVKEVLEYNKGCWSSSPAFKVVLMSATPNMTLQRYFAGVLPEGCVGHLRVPGRCFPAAWQCVCRRFFASQVGRRRVMMIMLMVRMTIMTMTRIRLHEQNQRTPKRAPIVVKTRFP